MSLALILSMQGGPGLGTGSAVTGSRHEAVSSPNIVLILTDDQRWDSLWAMPNVQSQLVDRGVTFDQSFVVNPVCCPSRTTILTGRYSHSTGVWTNHGPHGGFPNFHDASTLPVWLHDAGYETGLVGKYLNGYSADHASYIPPGWDQWAAFSSNSGQGSYYGYDIDVNGTVTHYGSQPGDYSTDVLASYADQFIRGGDPGRPLFLYLATRAPHQVAIPAPRHQHVFDDLPPLRPQSYNEDDVSDKPAYVQALPPWTPDVQSRFDTEYRDNMGALLAVDDAVGTVVSALADTGRLGNTLIMFASDNGLAYGEHRWAGKWVPYEESIRVPLVIRYDPLTASPRTDEHLVLNVDWTSTMAEVAGLGVPKAAGTSLLPLLAGDDPVWRKRFLIEHLESVEGIPSYCAVRTVQYLYAKYTTTGEEELYDLASDQFELQNVAGDPGYSGKVQRLRSMEARLCKSPPPQTAPWIRRLSPHIDPAAP